MTIDAGDPKRLAASWAGALGYIDEEGHDFEDGASRVDPDGQRPAVSFLWVPEAKTAKNRCHLDLWPAAGVEDLAERDAVIRTKVSALVTAGATITREASWAGHVEGVVMADPEDNEFCVAGSGPGHWSRSAA
ncbi:VOC family protein [Desertihabitans brevis]|uniref:VOC family protein n=1 Tax=Desertihabitans brevis TaxID=2268447 RepID=UPI0018F3FE0D|nr:VOC family protein [Desertihabitans brevis]